MILDMLDLGVRQVEIAQSYDMPKSTISNIFKCKLVDEEAETRGRNKKISLWDTRSILKVADELHFKPAHKIASTYNRFVPISVRVSPLRGTLKNNGVQNYSAASKPYISLRIMKSRLQWADPHEQWGKNQEDRVVLSCGSLFTVRPTSFKKRIWRKTSTKFDSRNLGPTYKSGYVSLSICGAFCGHGWTLLVRINAMLKQRMYKEIFESYIHPFAVEQYGRASDYVFC